MWKIQKIDFSVAKNSLAHLLLCEVQTKNINLKSDYENQTNLCFVSDQKQGITKVSLPVPQVHLHARKEDVFQNILSCIMDKCYIHII